MSDNDSSGDRPHGIPEDQDHGRGQAQAARPAAQAVVVPVKNIGETWQLQINGAPSSKSLRIVTTGGTVIVIPLGTGEVSIAITGGTDTAALGLHLEIGEPERRALHAVPIETNRTADAAGANPENHHDE